MPARAPRRSRPPSPSGTRTAAIGEPERRRQRIVARCGSWRSLALVVGGRRPRRPGPAPARAAAASAALSETDRAWEHALHAPRPTGATSCDPAETHHEFARRAGTDLDEQTADQLRELAELVARDRWDPTGTGPEGAARATALADPDHGRCRRPEGGTGRGGLTGLVRLGLAGRARVRSGQLRSLSSSESSSWGRRRLRTRSPVSPK